MRIPNLPQIPGDYLWWEVDLNCSDIGLVRVAAESEKHLAYLDNREDKSGFFLYTSDEGVRLVMYFDLRKPGLSTTGKPIVDGYKKVDLGKDIYVNDTGYRE